MKVLKIAGIIIGGIIILILVVALIAPRDYDVERTIVIQAPKALVFSHVKYWKNWKDWSPWAEQDSTMQRFIEGVDGEPGSVYRWSGDPDITGEGEMTNTGVKEMEEISYQLHFIEPWESTSQGYVRVSDAESGTQVAWGMYGTMPFPWNIFMLFMSMDEMISKDFDRGLTLLKDLVEDELAAIEGYQVKKVIFPAKNYAAIRKEISFNQMQSFYAESYGNIQQAMGKKGVKMIGAPSGLYYTWHELQMVTDMAAGIPIRGNLTEGNIQTIRIPMGTAYMINYYGPYEQLGHAHMAIEMFMQQNGLTMKPPAIEEYITDPGQEPDSSKWLTKIYYFAQE